MVILDGAYRYNTDVVHTCIKDMHSGTCIHDCEGLLCVCHPSSVWENVYVREVCKFKYVDEDKKGQWKLSYVLSYVWLWP